MSRDPARERRLLERIATLAGSRFAVDCRPYVRAVEERLALGAERHGDDLHDGRDLMAEMLEEPIDIAGWGLLLLQSRPLPPEVRDDVLRACVMAAVSDFYARRARDRLADEEGP